jgi:hypothetical protein
VLASSTPLPDQRDLTVVDRIGVEGGERAAAADIVTSIQR